MFIAILIGLLLICGIMMFIRGGAATIVAIVCLLVLVTMLGGCANPAMMVDVGAGKNTSFLNKGANTWDDQGGIGFYGAVRIEAQNDDWMKPFCQYMHVSQINANTDESSLDHLGCGVRFNLSQYMEAPR